MGEGQARKRNARHSSVVKPVSMICQGDRGLVSSRGDASQVRKLLYRGVKMAEHDGQRLLDAGRGLVTNSGNNALRVGGVALGTHDQLEEDGKLDGRMRRRNRQRAAQAQPPLRTLLTGTGG